MVCNFNTRSNTGHVKRDFDHMQQKGLFFIIQLLTVNVPPLTLVFIIELGRSEQRSQFLIRAFFHTCPLFPFDVSYRQNQ